MNEVASWIALAASFDCYTSSLYPAPRSPLVPPSLPASSSSSCSSTRCTSALVSFRQRRRDDAFRIQCNDRSNNNRAVCVRKRQRFTIAVCFQWWCPIYILLPSRFYMRIFVVHIHFRSNSILVETRPEMREEGKNNKVIVEEQQRRKGRPWAYIYLIRKGPLCWIVVCDWGSTKEEISCISVHW